MIHGHLSYTAISTTLTDVTHGLHARLALILHLMDQPTTTLIPTETVARAQRLALSYLLPQALDFFSTIAGSPVLALRSIGGWLLDKAPTRIRAADFTINVRCCRGMPAKELNDLLDPFVTGAWLEPESPYPSNRAWELQPAVRTHFAQRTQTERPTRGSSCRHPRNRRPPPI